ncbi:maltooligosyl trehalose hydrolase [Glaciihabitans tibetensis]|uniref:Malto-oligosyltrehalose trehalohydrolase n=1 Tax=Glaciihabitans tibetensis TaxID=1266600 RepID=A0A2T0VIK1_9MICO|nr:malto-oligosyltrehalose trehalohydrolase [Glaciihabitans tibetensis]PRY70051.1 maltooligosyl trehalose hydrolase [Glaciihabitans tibetensis]
MSVARHLSTSGTDTGIHVWAPSATQVDLRVGDATTPMVSGDSGWWTAPDAPAAGEAYGFVLDGGEQVIPDPRSRRQPHGVHEPSEAFDPAAHEWSDTSWTGRQLAGGMIYEMHLGTFTPEGTLDAAIERLDHLVDLGVDFVEVLPVNGFNGTHNWGYDGVQWYTVHEGYGGPAAYQRFVDACHARGLAVLQDVVYNHLGPSGNYLPMFGPYLHEANANTWGSSVNLDEPAVRRFILDNVAMWMRDYHVDGLRLDAVHALVDTNDKHILQEMAEETDALSAHLGRPLTLIAESDLNDPKLIMPREAGGYGLTAQWSDDYHHSVHVALTGETTGYYADFASLEALAKVSTQGFYHDGSYSSFREREHGHPIDPAVPTWRLVTFAQDHDQIGNRAIGDRLTASLDYGQLAIAAVLTVTGPFTPMLFMGEEWGASTPWQFFTSHPEPELGKATAEGRIAEFEKMGWDPDVVPDPQDPDSFHRSKLDWSEATEGDHARLLSLYRELGALRRAVPELTDPQFGVLDATYSDERRWFRLDRGSLSTLINFGDEALTLPLPTGNTVLVMTDASARVIDGQATLPPHSALIVQREGSIT